MKDIVNLMSVVRLRSMALDEERPDMQFLGEESYFWSEEEDTRLSCAGPNSLRHSVVSTTESVWKS